MVMGRTALSGTFERAYGSLAEAPMRKPTKQIFLAIFALLIAASGAQAQTTAAPGRELSVGVGTGTFGVRSIDFDLWCQQTQRYAADRCAARRPEDVRAFEDYRSSIERYEIDHLKQVQKDQDFRLRANRDPTQTVTGKQDGLP